MKFELKDFQVTATKALLDRMLKARDAYYRDGDPASCCLASPILMMLVRRSCSRRHYGRCIVNRTMRRW